MIYLWPQRVAYALGLLLVLCLVTAPTFAQKKVGRANDARRHSEDAAKVFNEIMGASDHAIPKELVDKAQAIAVFPGVLKAAFIVGGREGNGVRRSPLRGEVAAVAAHQRRLPLPGRAKHPAGADSPSEVIHQLDEDRLSVADQSEIDWIVSPDAVGVDVELYQRLVLHESWFPVQRRGFVERSADREKNIHVFPEQRFDSTAMSGKTEDTKAQAMILGKDSLTSRRGRYSRGKTLG